MRLNFYSVYETIKEKLVKENDQDGIKKLKNKIKENKNFSQSFIIYNNLKNKSTDFEIIKEFADGIKISQKELKELLEFFNIKDTKESKLNESFDNIINYKNKSLSTNLSTIKEDEEVVKKYLLDDSDEEQEEDLTFEEQSACSIIESKDVRRLIKKTGYVFALSKKLEEGKEKKMIQEAIKKTIQDRENLVEATMNIYSLYNRIQQINESKFGGSQKIKIGKAGIYSGVELSTEEDYMNPEYMILYIETPIKLFADSREEKMVELKKLFNGYVTELKSSLKKYLDPKTFMVGETITDTNVTTKTNPPTFKTQITLNIKPGLPEKQLRAYITYITALTNKLSEEMQSRIPQLNPKMKEA